MKRIALCAFSVLFASAVLGLAGCDSGGIDQGIPKDTTPSVSPAELSKMGDMSKMPKSAEEAAKAAGTGKASDSKGAVTPEKK